MEIGTGYQQTEVGILPSDWAVKQLKECCSKITDGTHDTPTPVKTGIPFLTAIHVKQNAIDFENCYFLPESIHKEIYRRCNPEKDDVLMVNIGAGVATTALVNVSFEFSLKNVALLKPNKKMLSGSYLNSYQEHRKGGIVAGLSSGGAQPFLSLGQIGEIQIALPKLSEQTAIATALSDADALISSLEKLIAKKRNIKQGVMQQLLQPKEGWDFLTYGEIFTFLNTATYSRAELSVDEEIGYVHYGDIHTRWNYFLDLTNTELPSISINQAKAYSLVEDGDVIMADASEDYSGIGKCIEIKNIKAKKLIAGLHTFLLRDKKGVFINGFKGYLHASAYIKNQFDKLATGMKVYGVSKTNLKSVIIPVPPKHEQSHIASILSDMEEDIAILEKKLRKYRRIKEGMMEQLLTGKIRLV